MYDEDGEIRNISKKINPISPGTFNPICAGKLHLCNCRVDLFKLNFLWQIL